MQGGPSAVDAAMSTLLDTSIMTPHLGELRALIIRSPLLVASVAHDCLEALTRLYNAGVAIEQQLFCAALLMQILHASQEVALGAETAVAYVRTALQLHLTPTARHEQVQAYRDRRTSSRPRISEAAMEALLVRLGACAVRVVRPMLVEVCCVEERLADGSARVLHAPLPGAAPVRGTLAPLPSRVTSPLATSDATTTALPLITERSGAMSTFLDQFKAPGETVSSATAKMGTEFFEDKLAAVTRAMDGLFANMSCATRVQHLHAEVLVASQALHELQLDTRRFAEVIRELIEEGLFLKAVAAMARGRSSLIHVVEQGRSLPVVVADVVGDVVTTVAAVCDFVSRALPQIVAGAASASKQRRGGDLHSNSFWSNAMDPERRARVSRGPPRVATVVEEDGESMSAGESDTKEGVNELVASAVAAAKLSPHATVTGHVPAMASSSRNALGSGHSLGSEVHQQLGVSTGSSFAMSTLVGPHSLNGSAQSSVSGAPPPTTATTGASSRPRMGGPGSYDFQDLQCSISAPPLRHLVEAAQELCDLALESVDYFESTRTRVVADLESLAGAHPPTGAHLVSIIEQALRDPSTDVETLSPREAIVTARSRTVESARLIDNAEASFPPYCSDDAVADLLQTSVAAACQLEYVTTSGVRQMRTMVRHRRMLAGRGCCACCRHQVSVACAMCARWR